MKIFLDTADYDATMRYDTGLIDGVTTNPSLIKRVVTILLSNQ